MELGLTFQAWLRAANSLRCLRSRAAARPSSIKSRSTSQYLSDEKSSEGVWSTSVVSSLVIISGRDSPDNLAELRRLRLDFAFRDRVRVVRPAPINSPQRFNIRMGGAVVRNRRNILRPICGDTGPLTIKRKKSVIKLKPSAPRNGPHEAFPFVKAPAKPKLAGSVETQPGRHLAALSAFRIIDVPIMAARNKDVRCQLANNRVG